ncbi:MAG: oligosaccharide flippase family protein, partial [Methanomethylovorans sp.]|nr:oligosaccharide flippase family protein [Methanomethylovorans sp.]
MNIKKRLIFFFSNSLFKNAYYLAANSIIGSLTGFIFWIIAARLFSTEDIGLASTIISAIGLLALLSNFGFNISLIRFLPELKDKSTTLINSCSLVSVSVAFILSIIFLYGTDFLSPSLSSVKSSGLFAMIFVSFTMLMVLASLHESVFVGFRKVDFSFRKMLIQNIIKIPLIFLFKAFGSLGIISAFGIAYLIATVVSVVI